MTTYTITLPPTDIGHDFDRETFEAPTHDAALSHMFGMLAVGGPRSLYAYAESGAEIYASLYDGESSIRSSSGALIHSS